MKLLGPWDGWIVVWSRKVFGEDVLMHVNLTEKMVSWRLSPWSVPR